MSDDIFILVTFDSTMTDENQRLEESEEEETFNDNVTSNNNEVIDNSAVYEAAVPMESDEMPLCTSCNMRTGNFCDGQNCENNRKRMIPANALCNSCYELSQGLFVHLVHRMDVEDLPVATIRT